MGDTHGMGSGVRESGNETSSMKPLTLLLTAAMAISGCASTPPHPPPSPDPVAASTDVRPGCAVGVVEDGRLSEARYDGFADLETRRPIDADTTFNIASMSKQLTAAAIGLLIADGKLAEDDEIHRHLPELPDYGVPIRVAHLLEHTSGIRNHMALAAFQPGRHLPTHEEALSLVFRQSALNFVPGTRHQYESANYVLLAEIVERVSGRPFGEFLEQRIFEPLGMTHSGSSSPTLARAYAEQADGSFALGEAVNTARGSSGVLTTLSDFALWMANYDHGKVGGAALRQRMLSTSTLPDGTPLGYRYGLVKDADHGGIPGLLHISHGGQTASYRSTFGYFPGKGFGTVVLCNTTADVHAIEAPLVERWLASRGVTGATPKLEAVTAPAAMVERLAGTYYAASDDSTLELVAQEGTLALLFYGSALPLTHRGDGRFVLEGSAEWRFSEADGQVTVVEDVPNQAKLVYSKLPAFEPQAASQFAGTYRSTDVDGEVVVQPGEGGLSILTPIGRAALRQIGPDAFAAPEQDFAHLAFTRGAEGTVDGLVLTVSSGITRMQFERVADSP
jgi:CubicO group peptidase (beta-lactamase class C family)